MKVTVTFKREEMDDYSTDLSYLQQDYNEPSTAADAAKYRTQDAKRLAAYYRGRRRRMIGIRAVATIWIECLGSRTNYTRPSYRTSYTLKSPGLWGIESDSGKEYLREVFEQECEGLRQDIEAIRSTNVEYKL